MSKTLLTQTKCSLPIVSLAPLGQLHLKCFFQIVFSARIIISVQFTPYHPHENCSGSDLANVETTIPCMLFCSQKHKTQNCFSANRHTVLWKNGISSHVKSVMYVLTKKNRPVILVALVAHHTPILMSSWHFVGLTQHFQQANACYSDSVHAHTKPGHAAETKQMWSLFLSSQFTTTFLVESVCRTYSLQRHTIMQLTED